MRYLHTNQVSLEPSLCRSWCLQCPCLAEFAFEPPLYRRTAPCLDYVTSVTTHTRSIIG